MTDWTLTQNELPPDGVLVDAMDSSGRVQQLKRRGHLWFLPDMSMYVYYTPSHWKRPDSDIDPRAFTEQTAGTLGIDPDLDDVGKL